MIKLVQELEEYRLKNRISQEELARKLGVAFSTVNRWFNRKGLPNKTQKHHIEKLILMREQLSKKKIDQINKRHNEIYKEYAQSDKARFAYYWQELEKLENEYFAEKYPELQNK